MRTSKSTNSTNDALKHTTLKNCAIDIVWADAHCYKYDQFTKVVLKYNIPDWFERESLSGASISRLQLPTGSHCGSKGVRTASKWIIHNRTRINRKNWVAKGKYTGNTYGNIKIKLQMCVVCCRTPCGCAIEYISSMQKRAFYIYIARAATNAAYGCKAKDGQDQGARAALPDTRTHAPTPTHTHRGR